MEKRMNHLILTVCSLWPLLVSQIVAERISSPVQVVTTDRLSELMSGQWMLEFYAPWCPACKQFATTWEDFAEWAIEDPSRNLRVGKVDVTQETMLSGQFTVTHLPTLYHILDGEVRVYHGSRSFSDLVDYVEEQKWQNDDPVPWWRSPTATHMRAIGIVFWLSEKAKDLQVVLEEKYELPTYAVFIVIAVATIVIGLSLGGLTVCCIEVCMRCCSRKQPTEKLDRGRKKEQEEPSESITKLPTIVEVPSDEVGTNNPGASISSADRSGKKAATKLEAEREREADTRVLKATVDEAVPRQRKKKGKKGADKTKD